MAFPYHSRRSVRLPDFDYSSPGAYFVTICTKDWENLFGEINDGEMILSRFGETARKCWQEILAHYPFIELDEYVIMPNHIHGILFIRDKINVGANNHSPIPIIRSPGWKGSNGTSETIGAVIRGFKIGVTKWSRSNTEIYAIWQRNYFESVIRNESELNAIRKYIYENPLKWDLDHERNHL